MRKMISYLLVLTATIVLFTNCSSKSDSKADGGKSENAKITVMAWNDAADALTAAVPGFEAKHPGIKVEIIKASETDDTFFSFLSLKIRYFAPPPVWDLASIPFE